MLHLLTNKPPVFQAAYCLHDSDLPKEYKLKKLDDVNYFDKETKKVPAPLAITTDNMLKYKQVSKEFPSFEEFKENHSNKKNNSRSKRESLRQKYENEKDERNEREKYYSKKRDEKCPITNQRCEMYLQWSGLYHRMRRC